MYTLKKSLGQHFLKDENISRNIVAALTKNPFDRLLEIGPGGGALTGFLLALPGIDFKAVELDDEKVAYLLKTFPAIEGKLIHKDFLEMEKPFDAPFTIVGNFPYNISTQILFRILAWRDSIQSVVGMFQKEVAARIAEKKGNKVYGVTSVLTQAFFEVEYLFDVHPGSFNPPPKVESGVIKLTPLKSPPAIASEKLFFNLVKTAFNQRRKTLRNAVRGLFDADTIKEKIFDLRAEQLSVEDFAALSFKMQSLST
jgi:16S rRNA (adenine1518-N6/adenine1519-N6)-dimethyltransferase